MKRSIVSITLLALISMAAMGQQRVVWNGQKVTKMRSVLFDTLGNQTDTILWETTVYHCADGKDSIAERVSQDGKQLVHFEYNEHRDLVARKYVLEDGRELTFTWTYTYDDAGRITEETALDAQGNLMAHYVAQYRPDGQRELAVNFVKLVSDFTVWERHFQKDGFKLEDPRYFPQANAYFYFNWRERRFYDKVDPFSSRPGADMYQRYTYQYTKEGRLLRARLYDIKRKNLEISRYYWNAELKLRSLENVQPERDSLKIVWDFRYDHQGRQYETNIYTHETGKLKRHEYEYEYKGGKLAKETRYYIGERSVVYAYGKHGELLSETWNDISMAKAIELLFRPDGRVNKVTNFRYGEIPYEQISYSYE